MQKTLERPRIPDLEPAIRQGKSIYLVNHVAVLDHAPVLCVDVDGTLLRTDLLFESLLALAKQKPWLLFLLPYWLMHGRAYLKRQLALEVLLYGTHLAIHQPLLELLIAESVSGTRIVLCSGSDKYLVQTVALEIGFPVEVIASEVTLNMTGKTKARVLVERFGRRGFDYAGNASDDLPVWREARHAIVVNASSRVQKAAEKQGNVTTVLPRSRSMVSAALRATRPYQ